jgi:hypothetical protein
VFVGLTAAQPYATWSRYRTITVNASVTQGALTNYPVLVRLANTGVAAGSNVLTDALPNGADVRFTDSTGLTALSYEIDSWSSSGAAIWVRLPSVPASGTAKIRLYWGKSGSTSASNAGSVFDSAGGFVGVWHLGNASGISARPNSITGAPAATPSNDVGSFGGGAGTYVAPSGQIGSADVLRGAGTRATPEAGSDYLNIGNPAGFDPSTFTGNNAYAGYNDFSTGFSYSLWVKAGTPAGAYSYLIELANANGCNDNIQVFRPATDARYRYEHCNGTTSGGTNQTPNSTLTEGVWEFYTFTLGTGATPAVTMYKNGARVTGPTNRTQPVSNILRTNAWLGKSNYDVDYYYTGSFDESRISRVARDSNWIRLDYATQRSDSSAVALGATVAPKALFYPQKTAVYLINDSTVNNTPTVSGSATGWAIAPAGLPTGLTFSTSTGVISGKPTAITASAQYIVSATVGGTPASDTITLQITAGSPPGAPTALTGTRASRQVALTWAAPAVTGGTPITGYKAMAVSDTTKSCTTTGALTCTITGLTNGTAYTFTVRASNGAGAGTSSAASAAVTPAGLPGVPTGVTIVQLSGAGATGTATMTWTAPSDSGATITNYFASSTPSGAACAATPPATTCTVSGLVYGTPYSVSVYAVNGVGSGALSAGASITTTGVRPGSLMIRVSGSARPFTFRIPDEALLATEKVTMSISDVWGRTLWTGSIYPNSDKSKEITWNGKASNGTSVSAGMYVVKIATTSGGITSEFTEKAVKLR